MSSFTKGPSYRVPFGKNVYLGSTKGLKFESYTAAAAKVNAVSVDGVNQKVLQPGVLMARIGVGSTGAGKVGPYQANATDGRQNASAIVGFNDTFLPNQLLTRDVAIGCLYDGTVDPAACFEYDNSGLFVPLTTTTKALVVAQLTGITYRLKSTGF